MEGEGVGEVKENKVEYTQQIVKQTPGERGKQTAFKGGEGSDRDHKGGARRAESKLIDLPSLERGEGENS